MKKRLLQVAAAVTMVVAATFLVLHTGWHLTVRSSESGQLYFSCPIKNGDEFAVGFIHSVNKNPLIDVYKIENHVIYVEQTIYYSFGAGVQTALNDGESLSYGADGGMIVSSIHKSFDQIPLRYLVGTISDHTLLLGDVMDEYAALKDVVGRFSSEKEASFQNLQVISLSARCGRHANVSFGCEFGFFM